MPEEQDLLSRAHFMTTGKTISGHTHDTDEYGDA